MCVGPPVHLLIAAGYRSKRRIASAVGQREFGIGRGSRPLAAVGLSRHRIQQAAMAEAGGLLTLAAKGAELVHHA